VTWSQKQSEECNFFFFKRPKTTYPPFENKKQSQFSKQMMFAVDSGDKLFEESVVIVFWKLTPSNQSTV